jgi:hypothetical protein
MELRRPERSLDYGADGRLDRLYTKGGIGIIHPSENGKSVMDTSRRLAILVFSAVPAIVGGGIVFAIFGSLTPMWIYEALLLVTVGALASR